MVSFIGAGVASGGAHAATGGASREGAEEAARNHADNV